MPRDRSTNRAYRIAVIPGDGIGKEVVPEGLRVLEAAAAKYGFALRFNQYGFSSADYYVKHGQMLPDDWKEQIGRHDALFFGVVGWPATVPDHVSLWGSLINSGVSSTRCEPAPCPAHARRAMSLDRPRARRYRFPGGAREHRRRVFVDRWDDLSWNRSRDCLAGDGDDTGRRRPHPRYAFDLARKREKKHLTSATKSNGISITMPYWDSRVEAMANAFPDVRWDKYHIDILTAHFVLNPDRFDVVVASNLFGDILSDLGPACTGTIGIARSGNINPERRFPSLFEPVHGSAPDIAGQGIANPVGQIWAAAMMLDHLGEAEASTAIIRAIERSASPGDLWQ